MANPRDIAIAKIIVYTLLVTIVSLVLGFAGYKLFHIQRFIALSIFYAGEGCLLIFFGATLLKKSPPTPDLRLVKAERVFLKWVEIRQLRENYVGAVAFCCAGLIIFSIGLALYP